MRGLEAYGLLLALRVLAFGCAGALDGAVHGVGRYYTRSIEGVCGLRYKYCTRSVELLCFAQCVAIASRDETRRSASSRGKGSAQLHVIPTWPMGCANIV